MRTPRLHALALASATLCLSATALADVAPAPRCRCSTPGEHVRGGAAAAMLTVGVVALAASRRWRKLS